MRKLFEDPTTNSIVIGGAALGIATAFSLAVSRAISILNPDNKTPASENVQSPFLDYQRQHGNATKMLEDALNGRPSPPATR